MDKLISMTDFVLEQGNPSNTDSQFADKVMAYAKFLKQPLTLGMFVPCDEEGVFFTEPVKEDYSDDLCQNGAFDLIMSDYQEAKERVMFEGFVYNEAFNEASDGTIVCGKLRIIHNGGKIKGIVWGGVLNTIEDLVKYNLFLTESAKQKIFNT